jgi:hypothetical protein
MQPTIHCNKKPDIEAVNVRVFSPDELRVAFSIPSGSLFLVNHLVFNTSKCFEANPIRTSVCLNS